MREPVLLNYMLLQSMMRAQNDNAAPAERRSVAPARGRAQGRPGWGWARSWDIEPIILVLIVIAAVIGEVAIRGGV